MSSNGGKATRITSSTTSTSTKRSAFLSPPPAPSIQRRNCEIAYRIPRSFYRVCGRMPCGDVLSPSFWLINNIILQYASDVTLTPPKRSQGPFHGWHDAEETNWTEAACLFVEMLQSVCQNREYCNVRGRKIPRIAIDITREREREGGEEVEGGHTHTLPIQVPYHLARIACIVYVFSPFKLPVLLPSFPPYVHYFFSCSFHFSNANTFVTVDINNRIAFTLTFSCRASYHHTHTTVKLHNRYFLDTIAMATLIALMVAMR